MIRFVTLATSHVTTTLKSVSDLLQTNAFHATSSGVGKQPQLRNDMTSH